MTCPSCQSTHVHHSHLQHFVHGGTHLAWHSLKHAGLAGLLGIVVATAVCKVTELTSKKWQCGSCHSKFD